MDGATFAKLCRDSGICAKSRLSSTSVDIIFSGAKPKGERKLTYKFFLEAVNAAAAELEVPYEQLGREIAHCKGPVFTGTQGICQTAIEVGIIIVAGTHRCRGDVEIPGSMRSRWLSSKGPCSLNVRQGSS